MANAIKGEVAFKAAGGDFKLVYDFNALCSIEEELEVDPTELGAKLSSPGTIRTVFRIGLAAHHGAMTDLEAGRLIHSMGMQSAGETIAKAFKAAFPDADTTASTEGKAQRKKSGATPAP